MGPTLGRVRCLLLALILGCGPAATSTTGIGNRGGAGRDDDGLADDVDHCPDDGEDYDDFEDDDGCPDPDNDRDGVVDAVDLCPNIPEDKDGTQDGDGCPEGDRGDRDGDGLLDPVDQCPDEPEDFDRFEDADGCPDPDNDQDGVLDVDDLCPNDPEDRDGFEDADGWRLSRFVYHHTRDFMRRVSRHVSIGAAYKDERPLDHYFVLCRQA